MNHEQVTSWMNGLKNAWEAGDQNAAVALFEKTQRYYERPFKPGTTQEEIRGYWKDIEGLFDIRLQFDIIAVEGNVACVHWKNFFKTEEGGNDVHLDGVFKLIFDNDGNCIEFWHWWFMEG